MSDNERSSIRPRSKIIGYIVAWAAALFTTNPNGSLWALAYIFPLGLAGFFNRRWGNDGGWFVLGACYAVYLVHAWFYFRSRNPRTTILLFCLLVILLSMNVPGCRSMINPH